jgi:hypothetical protein
MIGPYNKPLAKLTRLLRRLLKVDTGLLLIAVLAGIYGWIDYTRLAPNVDADETLLASDIANTVVGLFPRPTEQPPAPSRIATSATLPQSGPRSAPPL